MKDRKLLLVSLLVMMLLILIMAVNHFFHTLPDVVIRITGLAMMINIPILVIFTKRTIEEK